MGVLITAFFASKLFAVIKAVLLIVSFFLLLGVYFRLGDIRALLQEERKEKTFNGEKKR